MMNTRMGVMIGRNRRGAMGVSQIIIQTVITTVDVLLAIATVCAREMPDSHKKTVVALLLVNIVGVWL